MDPILGQICLFAFNFTPRGWAACNGQLLSIAQNTALFSLLGTTYGGDGRTTFALPDLRGRVPMHYGQGPGLSNRDMGEAAGTETQTLTIQQMPAHSHVVNIPVTSEQGTTNQPENSILAPSESSIYNAPNSKNGQYGGATAANAGGSQPMPIMQPYLVMNYCIATEGIFPSRS
jgi:microcystin-dependent protein